MSAATIGIVHGPNLNALGSREVSTYGARTLAEIDTQIETEAATLGVGVLSFQSNHEGEIIDWLYQNESCVGFVVNAGALTHTSVAIRDCLLAIQAVFVEVHLSNIHARESFRHRSMLADIARGLVMGFGAQSYTLGLRALVDVLKQQGELLSE